MMSQRLLLCKLLSANCARYFNTIIVRSHVALACLSRMKAFFGDVFGTERSYHFMNCSEIFIELF